MEANESVSSNQRHSFEDGSEECSRPSKLQRNEPEGDYLAALRGSNSEHWQNSLSKAGNGRGAAVIGRGRGRGSAYPKSSPLVAADHQEGSKESERLCPCGAGACLLLTANTAKNQGRKFYRCPLRKEEGQCNFFEWFDNVPCGGSEVLSGGSTRGSGVTFGSSQPQAELSCPCGAGTCTVRCAKSEKNMGRSFYRCPIDQEQGGCGFFKWCDDSGSSAFLAPNINSQTRATLSDIPMNAAKDVSGACFKCGMTGHWSNNCTSTVPIAILSDTPRNAAKDVSGACFKCGMTGHWSNDCTSTVPTSILSDTPRNAAKDASGACFKCGMFGHWSNNCTLAFTGGQLNDVRSKAGKGLHSSGGTTFGSCFKCGQDGHWAKDCPSSSSTAPKLARNFGSPYEQKSQFVSTGSAPKIPNASTFNKVENKTGSVFGASGFSNGDCFKCGSPGHWANKCPKK